MFQLIIFSKDRPAQLHALIESIFKNAHFLDITVICKATTPEFKRGYDTLSNKINFVWETDFKHNVLDSLRCKYISFATDDGIFFKDINNEKDNYVDILNNDEIVCISLRLGQNTPKNNYYSSGNGRCLIQISNNYMFWQHRNSVGNFAYPLSVDAHIFRRDQIKNIIEKTDFNNPNYLEGNIQVWNNEIPSLMCAPIQSVYVGNSINRVQNLFQNYAGGVHGITAEELNTKYLEGLRIDWEKFPYHEIQSPHHEFEVIWK